jgi:hypothetical protein
MKIIIYLSLCCFCLLTLDVSAQFQGHVYLEDSSIIVNAAGKQKTLAWCGGLNNPQFSAADLNHDGLNDLVLFQKDQYEVLTFINYGTAGNPDYRYRPSYAKNFPVCNDYLVLKDYNRDSVPDLFQRGVAGISAYRGYYNSSNELCFTFYKDLYYNNNSKFHGASLNAYVNPGDIPAIVDVDNDGDLDFLAYDVDGIFMSWFQNAQVETGAPKDSIIVKVRDQCWGKMAQLALRTHTLNQSCDNSYLLKLGSGSTAKVTDGGNSPCLIDMDGDGDYDVLDGHRAFNTIVYLKNGRIEYSSKDSMVSQDTTWTTLGDTVQIAQWAGAFHCDINQDGIRDLILTPNSYAASEDYKCIKYYKNIGTDKVPSFQYQSDTFLVENAIDAGSGSYPFLYDYNKDGKPDLFVGSKGYYEKSTGQYISRILYFQNTSTPGNPSFSLITNDFLGLSIKRYKGISIGIGDIDNDGMDDLLLGHVDGTVDYILNTVGSSTSQPNWSTFPQNLLDAVGAKVQTSAYSVPLVYDMNKDGHNDLILGDQTGYIYYYQNVSFASGTINLRYTNNQLGLAKSDPSKPYTGYSTPFIGKMDNTGIEYLMMGSRSGRIFRYTGFQAGYTSVTYPIMDSSYSYILDYGNPANSYMSAPAIADIDGDGKYEMIVGNVYGGLFLYKQALILGIEETQVPNKRLLLFPNPAKNDLNIALDQVRIDKDASVSIYNNMGQLVMLQQGFADPLNIKLDISQLPVSVYLCVLKSGNEQYNSVFVKKN